MLIGSEVPYNLRFPGQYYDSETGLNQNYFRDYDPLVGRYVESDPIGLRAGVNTYAYAGDDPVRVVDPGGLDAIPIQSLRSEPNPYIATVICDGQSQPISQIPLLQPIYEKCIGDCMLVHEYSHIDDLIALGIGGTVCQSQPRGIVITVPPSMHEASEKKAYAAELACLEKKLQGLSDCAECRRTVMERIKKVQKWVQNPP